MKYTGVIIRGILFIKIPLNKGDAEGRGIKSIQFQQDITETYNKHIILSGLCVRYG